MDQVRPTGKPFVIAARISGPAKTAFPDGPPAGDKDAGKQIKSAKAINVIVMADTDIFDDRFWVRSENLYGKTVAVPFADNGAFVLNAVENLTARTISSRCARARPTTAPSRSCSNCRPRRRRNSSRKPTRCSRS